MMMMMMRLAGKRREWKSEAVTDDESGRGRGCEEQNQSWRNWNKVDGVKRKAGSAETRFPLERAGSGRVR